MRNRRTSLITLAALSGILLAGCPSDLSIDFGNGTVTIPGRGVTVDIYNDTDFDVDPRILFDDDSGFFASLAPSELLATGVLLPGEALTYVFDCDELGLILSDEADQFVGDVIYRAWPSRTLERGSEYDCGDLIEFQFVGNADTFGVVVAVNGFVID